MKKNVLVLAVSAIFLLSACGPSAEEQAAAAQYTQDSLASVEKAMQDSMAAAAQQQAMQDSMNMMMETMRQDSMKMAAEMAKMKKSGTKPKKKVEPKATPGGIGKPKIDTTNTPDKPKVNIGRPK